MTIIERLNSLRMERANLLNEANAAATEELKKLNGGGNDDGET